MHDDWPNDEYEYSEDARERWAEPPDGPVRVDVEFIGGPFDGHRQIVPQGVLQRQVCLPVGPGMFEWLDGRNPESDVVTSVAVYLLFTLEEGARYMFYKTIKPQVC